jgi:UDP-3-O-[3-hydroxymyristoyl] glucosamine N-acyltransferase
MMASYSLEELARIVGGEIIGPSGIVIDGVAGIKEAEEGQITFLANPRYESYLSETNASAVIANRDGDSPRTILKVDNPYLAFLKVVTLFDRSPMERYERSVHPTAVVDESAVIGEEVAIGAYAVIGKNVVLGDRSTILAHACICENVTIGKDCLIYPHVTIRERSEIGNEVIIHAGAVIGSDGFGYAKDGNTHHKIPQIGIVRLEDNVEIGANATIDRATTGVTLVRRGSKIDNLVQLAHNVVVGEDSVLAAQVGISGSTEIGRNVVLGGQAGLVGHITIGDGSMVGAQGGVTKSIPPETRVSGYPAREHTLARKIYAATKRLPDVLKDFRKLQERIEELEKGRRGGTPAEDD